MPATDIALISWAGGFCLTLGYSLSAMGDDTPGLQVLMAAIWPMTWLVVFGYAIAGRARAD